MQILTTWKTRDRAPFGPVAAAVVDVAGGATTAAAAADAAAPAEEKQTLLPREPSNMEMKLPELG